MTIRANKSRWIPRLLITTMALMVINVVAPEGQVSPAAAAPATQQVFIRAQILCVNSSGALAFASGNTALVQKGKTTTSNAICDSGYHLQTGGYTTEPGGGVNKVFVSVNSPTSISSWRVQATR